MPKIIPAILAKSESDFIYKLRLAEEIGASEVHVDIMDGQFVDNTTWFDHQKIKKIKTNLKIELHLMVNDPLPIIRDWTEVSATHRAIPHAEISHNLSDLFDQIESLGLEKGLAVNPKTKYKDIKSITDRLDLLLIMGGEPGKSGQVFDKKILKKIKKISKKCPNCNLGVDIGVNLDTAPKMVDAGISHLVAASAIFGSKNPQKSYENLNKLFT